MQKIINGILWTSIVVYGCRLHGFDSGECVDPDEFKVTMPFCSDIIPYRACLPKYQSLWYNHSAITKDAWVEKLFNQTVTQQMIFEQDTDLQGDGTNEWGEPMEIVPRFTENPDCVNAFRNYFCWLNFPRCDAEGRSLLMCKSVCENFFISCQQPESLWRCGDPKYVNAKAPEVSDTQIDGELVYFRFPFPGSPFRENSFEADGITPRNVCTPSLANEASRFLSDPITLLPMVSIIATNLN